MRECKAGRTRTRTQGGRRSLKRGSDPGCAIRSCCATLRYHCQWPTCHMPQASTHACLGFVMFCDTLGPYQYLSIKSSVLTSSTVRESTKTRGDSAPVACKTVHSASKERYSRPTVSGLSAVGNRGLSTSSHFLRALLCEHSEGMRAGRERHTSGSMPVSGGCLIRGCYYAKLFRWLKKVSRCQTGRQTSAVCHHRSAQTKASRAA